MSQRFSTYTRKLQITFTPNPIKKSAACFLWGPRQTGKTTYIQQHFPRAAYYDLLDSDQTAAFTIRPKLLREEVAARKERIVIIDEIQKVPTLIDEVHWLLEHTNKQFILCGSSARKLRRGGKNLLGGRATAYSLFPLTSSEVPNLNLEKMLNHGGLPSHYLSPHPGPLLKAYVNTYVKEEIVDESLTRNIPAFSRFLEVAALTHGQQLNYANIARECGVSASTVRSYYTILTDTLLGFELPPWRKRKKRRLVDTSKYFFFDIGVANYLSPEVQEIVPGSNLYGRSFEHFLINEIRAYQAYHYIDRQLAYWRTSTGFEVDLIMGNMNTALEFKASTQISDLWLRGLRALGEEHAPQERIVVSLVDKPLKTEDGIQILPWKNFCRKLWQGSYHQ